MRFIHNELSSLNYTTSKQKVGQSIAKTRSFHSIGILTKVTCWTG